MLGCSVLLLLLPTQKGPKLQSSAKAQAAGVVSPSKSVWPLWEGLGPQPDSNGCLEAEGRPVSDKKGKTGPVPAPRH